MHIVVITGAGMSAESGVPTFRGAGGLWEGHRVQDVATPAAWRRDPEQVLRFYNERRAALRALKPNAGHRALARLERSHRVSIVTQNVDDLHERAGSTAVLHVHGQLMQARSSTDPDCILELGTADIALGDTAPDGSQLRPHVVWFGEPVPVYETAAALVAGAEACLIVGTSLQVYPAAFLVDLVPAGIPVILIDPEPGVHPP
ncbi:MAG: Sir2 family NAD-dependent protein deacetylase, partial [Planctomycetota bacterium]